MKINLINTSSLSQTILAGIFIFFISIPLSTALLMPRKDLSTNEKRVLAAFPRIDLKTSSFLTIPHQFESYYQDHFGFREQFIFLNNLFKVKVLKKSPVAEVVIGKQGWLFQIKDSNLGISVVENYRGLSIISPMQLEAIKVNLETKRSWLAKQGIQYALFIAPDKQTIYPEYMPDQFTKVGEHSQIDQLYAYLKQHSDIRIIDARPSLLQAKTKGILYYQSDTHWNELGAFIATEILLVNLFPFKEMRDPKDLHITYRHTKGLNLSTMVGLPDYYEDEEPIINDKPLCARKIYDEEILKLWNQKPKTDFTAQWYQQNMPFKTVCGRSGIRAVVFRDSFFSAMLPFFAEHFEQAVYIWSRFDFSILPKMIQYMKPDIVIEECVERELFLNFSTREIHRSMGADLLISGRTDEAIEAFTKALADNPTSPDNYYNLGLAFLQKKNLSSAILLFQKALKIDPAHEKSAINMQKTIALIKRVNTDIDSLLKKMEMTPDDPDLHFQLAQLLQQKGETKTAVAQLQKVLSMDPVHPKALNSLALLYANEKQYDQAVLLFLKLAEIQQYKPEVCYNIACLYSLQNNVDEALKWLNIAIRKGYNNWNLIRYDTDLDNIRHTKPYQNLIKDT